MSGFRWTDEDGDEAEVIDWHAENPSTDNPAPPCAGLRVRRPGDDWAPVLLTKSDAAEVIAWLTEFYGLSGTFTKRAVTLGRGDMVWADGDWLKVARVRLDEDTGIVTAFRNDGSLADFYAHKKVLVMGR